MKNPFPLKKPLPLKTRLAIQFRRLADLLDPTGA